MPIEFFFGWALWLKMTFVLALAIFATFIAGFGKLWWLSRQKRKNTILDEEKRAKQEEMRMSRLIINVEDEGDIPFGVRAIESGIQVDGIWVSRSNTPVSESLRSFHLSEASIASVPCSKGSDGSISPGNVSPRDGSLTGLPLPTFRQTRPSFEGAAQGECTPPASRLTSSKQRESAYKPRQSSQLRFSSYGDIPIDPETLSQLEGTTPPKQTALHPYDHSSYAPILADSEGDVGADNRKISGTGSEATRHSRERNRRSHQSSRPSPSATLQHERIQNQVRRSDESADGSLMSNTREHSSHALPHVPRPVTNSFTLPDFALTLPPAALPNMNVPPKDEIAPMGETQWPLLSTINPSYPEEPFFTPGTLHVNKAVRKVNSGFEVLPAGTFDAINTSNNPVDAESPMLTKRMSKFFKISNRLQKKRRESKKGGTTSMV